MSDGISIATMLRSKQACSRTPPRSNEAKQAARSSGVTPIAEHCSPSPLSAPAALGQRPSARTAPSPHAGRAQAQLRARRCLNAGAKLPTCTLPLAPLAAPAGGPHPRPAAVARSAAPREATGAVRAGQRQGRPRARSGSRAAARRFAALPALPVVSRCALLAAGLLYASAVTQTNEGGHRHAGSSPCPTDGRGASRPPRTSRFRAASPGPLRSNFPPRSPAPPLHTRRSGAFPRSRSDPRGAPRPPDPRPQKFRGPPSAARPLPADPPRTAGLRGAQQVRAGRSPSSRSSNTGLLEEEALAPILFFHLPQWNIGPSGWHAPRAAPRRPAAPASGTNGPEPRSAAPRPAAARPHDSPAPPARGGCRSAAGRGGAGRGGCGREGREWRHAAPPAAAGGQRRSQVR